MTTGTGARLYELRTFVAKDDRWEPLVERWESEFRHAFGRFHRVLGAFAAHPENSEMPIGIAVLLRHDDAAARARNLAAMAASRAFEDGPEPRWADLVERITSQFLDPLAFSRLT